MSKLSRIIGEGRAQENRVSQRAATEYAKSPAERFAAVLGEWFADKTPATIETYKKDVEDFTKWLGHTDHNKALLEFVTAPPSHGHTVLRMYKQDLMTRDVWRTSASKKAGETPCRVGLASKTVNRRLSVLQSFSRLAFDAGIAKGVVAIKGLRETTGEVKVVHDDDWRKLVSFLKEQARQGKNSAYKDIAILRLMRDVGLRRKEVLALQVEDIDLKRKTLSIQPKGPKDHKVTHPIAGAAWDALQDWVFVRDNLPGSLFGLKDLSSLNKRLKTLGRKAGVPDLSPHQLRRAGITQAVTHFKGDYRRTQGFARHKSPEVTARYDMADRESDIREVIEALGEDDLGPEVDNDD
jgi:integrase/recombinase XerC